MKKKTEEILLKLSKSLYKKKYLKIDPNKRKFNDSELKNIINKEKQKIKNKEKNKHNNQKQICFNEKKIEIKGKENILRNYNSNKIINGLDNNQTPNIKCNKIYKTINNLKKKRNYLIENYLIKNNSHKNIKENENDRLMEYFDSIKINKTNDKNEMIDLKRKLLPKNIDNDNSIRDRKIEIINNNNFDEGLIEIKSNGREKNQIPKNINIKYNNINNNLLNSSLSFSPKLFFDYKRISNLLVTNNSIETNIQNKTNDNIFRKKKINNSVNNSKNNDINSRKEYMQTNEKKLLFKNSSFNKNKRLENNDDKNDDIQINNFKKYEINNNLSSIALSNNTNNSNIFERNKNLYFSPSRIKNQKNNYNSYNSSSRPSTKTTENRNFFFTSQYSNNSIYNNTIIANNRVNINNKDINRKNNEIYSSAINIFNKKEKKGFEKYYKNKIPTSKPMKTIHEKRNFFRKKNNTFNKNINNDQIKINKINDKKDLEDDISFFNDFNKLNNQNKIISDYCSSDFNKENRNKRKIFCFNNYGKSNKTYNDQNNNRKINIKKTSIQNVEENKNIFIDDIKIDNIINKYTNNSIENSRYIKNKKMKNLIFTYERLFKHHNSFFQSKANKNKKIFFIDNNKDDISFNKNKNKKLKIKYLTPNTTAKNKNTFNFLKNKNQINEYNYQDKKDNENNIKNEKQIICPNKNNYEFDINRTQTESISILNKIKNENKSEKCFKKVKDFLKKNFPSNEENRKDNKFNKKKKNLIKTSDKEKKNNKNIFLNNIKREQKKVINDDNSLNNSKNSESAEYFDNIPILLKNRNIENDFDYNKENNNLDENSDTNKENSEYNLNKDINKEYFKEIQKPIIINSNSFIHDNYGYNKYHGSNIKRFNDEFIFENKTINNCSKRKQNIIRNNKNNQTKYDKIKRRNCNCEKEYYEKNEDEKMIDSENYLLITNITKCPKCHCIFGRSSKIYQK